MRQIIDVKLKTRQVSQDVGALATELLAVGLFSDAGRLDTVAAALDKKLGGAIKRLLKLGDFKGAEESGVVLYGDGRIAARRVLLVGLGEKKEADLDTLRRAAAYAANKAVSMRAGTLALVLHKAFAGRLEAGAMGRAMAEGSYFGSYRYDEFVTQSKDGRLASLRTELVDTDRATVRQLAGGAGTGSIIGRAQNYARTLTNRPGNVINPAALAAAARRLARQGSRLTCTILEQKQIKQKKMGGLLAVGSGSQNGPRFIVLRYTPAGQKAKNGPKVALVGKAITFDSGGISIKPSANMQEMKLDKTGGIVVLATMQAAAEMKLPVRLLGIIPAAENMPSGTSYRPGDIITTFSGKTVEVQNTDAEGRMILCDGLTYAVRQNCDIIIDVATLTGACMVALGRYMAGLMGNDEELIRQLQASSRRSGEKVWPMPSGDEYAKEMKSKVADLKNIGSKWGGACTAAAFLRQFVEKGKWAHLDIAGMDMFDKPTEYSAAGSSGFGVRLLCDYLMNSGTRRR